MTPSGIEPGTFRFVAQYLNRCATAVSPLVACNYDKFLIKMHRIFNRQLGLYVNMLISSYFFLLYCHWFYCVVRVVLGLTNELYVFLLCCLISCACPL
jgi:hypothetical protein